MDELFVPVKIDDVHYDKCWLEESKELNAFIGHLIIFCVNYNRSTLHRVIPVGEERYSVRSIHLFGF